MLRDNAARVMTVVSKDYNYSKVLIVHLCSKKDYKHKVNYIHLGILSTAATGLEATAACQFGGMEYADGELVPTFDECEDCYCMEGEVICAKMECVAPGPNCIPSDFTETTCCPTSYDCSKYTQDINVHNGY